MRGIMNGRVPRLGLTVVLASVISVAACRPPPSDPPCVVGCAQLPTSSLTGEGRVVSHLLRSVLPPGAVEEKTSFFIYLYFADNEDERTLGQRRKVAGIMLDLFDGLVARSKVEDLLKTHAILYVPMAEPEALPVAIHGHDLNVFLDAYDYQRARALRTLIEERTEGSLPRVALIGSAKPLLKEELDLRQLYIMSLELPPRAIEKRIDGLREALLSRTGSPEDVEISAARRSGGFFQSLAED